MAWPQTIAYTPANPDTDMGEHLRSFLTIVGTEPGTGVTITLSTDVLPLPDPPPGTTGEWYAGDRVEFTLGPYEVLNLETGGFNADFTGTVIESDKPIAVYSGSEASDVPCFPTLETRRCCADHLEEQLLPDSSYGNRYVFARTPMRSPEVYRAGAVVSVLDNEPEYVRIMAVRDDTEVRMALTDDVYSYDMCRRTEVDGSNVIYLNEGEYTTRELWSDAVIYSTKPIQVGQFVASQEVTGIDYQWPGGDPVFIVVPPIEQWRSSYVFLTPGLYAFDYLIVTAPKDTFIELDKDPMPRTCQTTDIEDTLGDSPQTYRIYRCPLSRPEVTGPRMVEEGEQHDGVHEIRSVEPATGRQGAPFGLVVYGFDAYVSYGYPGGLNLLPVPE
jgi:hypothetical protein